MSERRPTQGRSPDDPVREPSGSGLLEDLLGADPVDAIDGAGADEVPIGVEDIAGSAGDVATRRRNAAPRDLEAVTTQPADALLDRSGHDPLHGVGVGGRALTDDDGARVLDPDGVGAIDRVGAEDAGAIDHLAAGDGATGEGNGNDSKRTGEHDGANHPSDRSQRRGLPRWSKVLGSVVGLLVGAALAFAIIQPIKVLPRIRVAPGFAFTDQSGEQFTSESARGSVTLYAFAPVDCPGACKGIDETIREVQDRVPSETDLGDVDFQIVTIALADDPSIDELGSAADRSGADGATWRWVGGDWDRVRTVVGAGFRRFFEADDDGAIDFDPGFVLVDGNGVIRSEYRYQTLASDADKIVRQVGLLGDELRLSNGAASLAYEAAHLFLCYG